MNGSEWSIMFNDLMMVTHTHTSFDKHQTCAGTFHELRSIYIYIKVQDSIRNRALQHQQESWWLAVRKSELQFASDSWHLGVGCGYSGDSGYGNGCGNIPFSFCQQNRPEFGMVISLTLLNCAWCEFASHSIVFCVASQYDCTKKNKFPRRVQGGLGVTPHLETPLY